MKTDTLIVSLVFASLASPFARAGDPEFQVNPANPAQIGHEFIPAGPGGTPPTFSWRIVSDFESPGDPGPRLAPGFPLLSCSSTAVLQSLGAAASAWNNASLPNGTPVARLALSTAPAATLPGNGTTQIRMDSINKVSLWEPASFWAPLGGGFTLAASPGNAVPPSSFPPTTLPLMLVETDIAVNTTANTGGVPFWSFTETVGGTTFGTWPSPGVARTAPIFGYADLQGVLTHEFGHVIGLGHSLVDSVMQGSLSLTPTMFEWAQAEVFGAQSITVPDSTCNVGSWSHVVSLATSSLFGRSARSLEPDDLTAVFRGYPAALPSTPSTPGSITGEVWMRFPDGSFLGNLPQGSLWQPALAVSVVAVSVNDPNGLRVGTMSYAVPTPAFPQPLWHARYDLTLLPPGDYYVAVEPLGNGYFSTPGLPNYALVGGNSPTPVNQAGFVAEFYDANESHFEGLSQVATPVHVNAGLQTQLSKSIDLETSPSANRLTVQRNGSTLGPSARGVRIPNLGGGAAVTLRLSGLVPTPVGSTPTEGVYLGLATQRTLTPNTFGQLLQISPFQTLTGYPDTQGVVQFSVPVPSTVVYTSVFAQAVIFHANSVVELTNVVNVWTIAP